jgi:phosphoglycerate kinase
MRFDVPRLDDLALSGKRVLVRVDFNVPQDETGLITDDTRIRAAHETIQEILEKKGKPVLMSHLGRPDGQVVESLRLTGVAKRLEELTKRKVVKLDESIGPAVEQAVRSAPAGSIVLLENVRFHKGETKGEVKLAEAYARLGDVFVNDAFGTAHRAESSVSVVAQFLPSAAGRLVEREVAAFRRVLENPARPLIAILGGAKVSDKLPVVANLIPVCDALLIGGGMAYTFLKAKGEEVGASKLQADQLEAVKQSLAAAEKRGCRILLPSDHVVAERFAEDAPPSTVARIPREDGARHRPRDAAVTPPRSPGRRPSSGTVRWASSSGRPSAPAPPPWRGRWPRRRATPWSAGATRSRPSSSSASPRR